MDRQPLNASSPQPSPPEEERGRRRALVQTGLAFLLGTLALSARGVTYEPSIVLPPQPVREYRAAWIASVGNIDWPSRPDLSTADQKAELLAMLDRAVQLKLNAIILQVRPACDALYASKIEPWSEYLTGTMGKAPEPYYDPLAFAVAEAHRRGLELHAWFNPYRAALLGSKSPVAANHVTRTHPNIVRHYGKYLWLDPGEPETQEYSLGVILDVVRRYDVDGVHLDDYFYPYKVKDSSGQDVDFPDDPSWRRYGAGKKVSRDDWRRENVNTFIERLYRSIKGTKSWVKFGISPFGIWQPGYPAQIDGFDAYGKLYADSRKWLAQGWVDYFAPQLYWAISAPQQSFPVLLKWWAEQNRQRRHLMPGLDATKAGRQWKPEEIVNQVRLTRRQPGADGQIQWNMRSLMRNTALDEALKREVYAQPALVPASPWLGKAGLKRPRLTATHGSPLGFSWKAAEPDKPALWLVQRRLRGEWSTEILPAARTEWQCIGTAPEVVAVSGVDRNGNIGAPASLQLRP